MNTDFGITLKKFIKGSDLKVHALADSVGKDVSYIGDILEGKVVPTSYMIFFIAKVLGLTRYETEFLFFLAKKVPPDSKMFSSFHAFKNVMDVADSQLAVGSVQESKEVFSPLFQVTTPGEICRYWQKTCYRNAGRTKLVLLSSIIKVMGLPPVNLPFPYDPHFNDVSILDDVFISGELCSKYDVNRSTLVSVLRYNDSHARFTPETARKSGGDWIFLEESFKKAFNI